MKLTVLSLTLLIVSCSVSSGNNEDALYQARKDTSNLKEATVEAKDAAIASNEIVWKKIVQRPDSVSMSVIIDDTLKATLIISGALNSNYYHPQKIEVFFSDSSKQEVAVTGNVVAWEESQVKPYVDFQDINFDGSADLHLFDNAGATGNFWYSVWLFDPGKKEFLFSKAFSDICAPKIDNRSREILSYSNLGGLTSYYGDCDEHIVFYTIKGNQPTMVGSIFNHAEKSDSHADTIPCPCITYKRELQGKNWKESNLGEWYVTLYDSIYAK